MKISKKYGIPQYNKFNNLLLPSETINEKNINGKTPSDLTTNLEIKKLLDDYIKKKGDNLNNNKISKVTKETKTAMNTELNRNRIKKENNNNIGKFTKIRIYQKYRKKIPYKW